MINNRNIKEYIKYGSSNHILPINDKIYLSNNNKFLPICMLNSAVRYTKEHITKISFQGILLNTENLHYKTTIQANVKTINNRAKKIISYNFENHNIRFNAIGILNSNAKLYGNSYKERIACIYGTMFHVEKGIMILSVCKYIDDLLYDNTSERLAILIDKNYMNDLENKKMVKFINDTLLKPYMDRKDVDIIYTNNVYDTIFNKEYIQPIFRYDTMEELNNHLEEISNTNQSLVIDVR